MQTHIFRLAVVLSVVFVACVSPLLAGEQDKRLDIYWIDTEGGAATLVVTPQGESLLVDTGNPGHRDPDRIVQVATRMAGLRQIDHLVVTHYHGDHFGGAATLATLLPIKRLYDNGKFEGQREFPDKAYSELKCDERLVLSPGDEIKLQADDGEKATPLRVRCLAARQKVVDAPADASETEACAAAPSKPVDNSDNANSIVLLLSFGPFRFFDAGDLTWNIEKQLACPKNIPGIVDVYQVTHHGLDTSNNPVLIQALQPTVAMMNNGHKKGCEPMTFATLKGTESIKAIFQVHRNLRPDGEVNNTQAELVANHEEKCQGLPIKLSVEPDGTRYSVSIPSTGVVRSFETRNK
jgi:beta-lactamase superfamily II metal-dependent hydrolase